MDSLLGEGAHRLTTHIQNYWNMHQSGLLWDGYCLLVVVAYFLISYAPYFRWIPSRTSVHFLRTAL